MAVSLLTSIHNQLLKTIRLVSSGSRRAPKELVVAEGIRVLEEVCRTGHKIKAAVFTENFGENEREQNLLQAWLARDIPLYKLKGKLFESVSSVQTPQGALALVEMRNCSLSKIGHFPNPLILYACGIQDPGNLGTLIRTAAAAGVNLICTSKGTVSAKNTKSIRASAGAFFHLPPIEQVDFVAFRDYCQRLSIQPFRAEINEGTIHTKVDLKSPAAILLGNEGSGMMGSELKELHAIRIPMAKGIESLNVAAAGAVILFEASRQRNE